MRGKDEEYRKKMMRSGEKPSAKPSTASAMMSKPPIDAKKKYPKKYAEYMRNKASKQ